MKEITKSGLKMIGLYLGLFKSLVHVSPKSVLLHLKGDKQVGKSPIKG